jgi:hypothetical protein
VGTLYAKALCCEVNYLGECKKKKKKKKKTIGVINCECLIYMQGRCRGGGGEVIAPPFPTVLKQYRDHIK